MASLQVIFQATVSDGPFGTDTINPGPFTFTVGGPHVRRSVTVGADASVTLDVGELSPRWWWVRNIHETASISLSFGSADDMQLEPGDFCFFRSSSIPVARGLGADATLYYACFQGA